MSATPYTPKKVHVANGNTVHLGQELFNTGCEVHKIVIPNDNLYWAHITIDAIPEEHDGRTQIVQVLTYKGKKEVEKNLGAILTLNEQSTIDRKTGKFAIPLKATDETRKVGFLFFSKTYRLYEVAEMNANYIYLRDSKAWIVETTWIQELEKKLTGFKLWSNRR